MNPNSKNDNADFQYSLIILLYFLKCWNCSSWRIQFSEPFPSKNSGMQNRHKNKRWKERKEYRPLQYVDEWSWGVYMRFFTEREDMLQPKVLIDFLLFLLKNIVNWLQLIASNCFCTSDFIRISIWIWILFKFQILSHLWKQCIFY